MTYTRKSGNVVVNVPHFDNGGVLSAVANCLDDGFIPSVEGVEKYTVDFKLVRLTKFQTFFHNTLNFIGFTDDLVDYEFGSESAEITIHFPQECTTPYIWNITGNALCQVFDLPKLGVKMDGEGFRFSEA